MRKATRSYHTYSSLEKLQIWLLSLRWKTRLWVQLQPMVPEFVVRPALGQNTHDDDDDDDGDDENEDDYIIRSEG